LNQVHRCSERDSDGKETIMKIRMLLALALTLLAISACVVEPIGGRGYYGGGGRDYGRGVWRG
jgi:hypothetical protein